MENSGRSVLHYTVKWLGGRNAIHAAAHSRRIAQMCLEEMKEANTSVPITLAKDKGNLLFVSNRVTKASYKLTEKMNFYYFPTDSEHVVLEIVKDDEPSCFEVLGCNCAHAVQEVEKFINGESLPTAKPVLPTFETLDRTLAAESYKRHQNVANQFILLSEKPACSEMQQSCRNKNYKNSSPKDGLFDTDNALAVHDSVSGLSQNFEAVSSYLDSHSTADKVAREKQPFSEDEAFNTVMKELNEIELYLSKSAKILQADNSQTSKSSKRTADYLNGDSNVNTYADSSVGRTEIAMDASIKYAHKYEKKFGRRENISELVEKRGREKHERSHIKLQSDITYNHPRIETMGRHLKQLDLKDRQEKHGARNQSKIPRSKSTFSSNRIPSQSVCTCAEPLLHLPELDCVEANLHRRKRSEVSRKRSQKQNRSSRIVGS